MLFCLEIRKFLHTLREDKLRNLIIITLCFVPYGVYWTYDIPGAIQVQTTEWFGGEGLHYDEASNLLLYSVYSYPNVIMPFFVGFIVDKLSLKTGICLSTGFVLVGQIVFSVGVQFRSFFVCVMGRFLLGVGGEAIAVSQFKFAAKWFPGEKLSLYYGIIIGFARFGTVMNFVISPLLAKSNFVVSIWFGTIVCVVSFLLAFFTGLIDKTGEEKGYVTPEDASTSSFTEVINDIKEIFNLSPTVWVLVNTLYWFSTTYITILAISANILHKTGLHLDVQNASTIVALPSMVAIFGPALFGHLNDKYGRSLTWGLSACFLLLFGLFGLLMLTIELILIHPAFIMIIIGIAYSIYIATLLTLIPFVVPENTVGRVSGLVVAMENVGYIVIPSIVGFFQTDESLPDKQALAVSVDILLVTALLSVWFCIILFLLDKKKTGGILNSPPKEKNDYRDLINSANFRKEETEHDVLLIPRQSTD